jgi:DNA-binding FadR family transcriptional regulator
MELTQAVVRAVEPENTEIHPSGLHRSVVEAVLAKNSDKAANAMKKHAGEIGKILAQMEKAFQVKKSAPAV